MSISEEIHEFHPLPPAPKTEHKVEVLATQEEIYKRNKNTEDIPASKDKKEEPKKEIPSQSSIFGAY